MANTKITSRVLADNAVLTANITDANVTTAKVADNAVTGDKVADDVALAGNPTTTTQSAGNNTTRIATTAFVSTAVANLADSAPDALNTLNELAAALGDDANFSTTVTNSIAAKLPLAGGTMTGNIVMGDDTSIGIADDAERIEFDGAGDINILGANLGIGTTSPKAVLTTDPESGNFSSTYNNYDGVGLFIRGNGTSGNGNYGAALAFGSCDSDTANQDNKHAAISIVQTGTDPNETGLAFWTHPTNTAADALAEKMRIEADGKVGIGTTSPSHMLHVNAADGASDNTQAMTIENNEATDGRSYGLKIKAGSTVNDAPLFIQDHDAANDLMIVRGNGAVGIGTTSPAQTLHTSGTGVQRIQVDATDNNAAGAGLYMKVLNSGSLVGNATVRVDNVGNIDFFNGTSSESQKMTILAGGNVGIGTTAPATKLQLLHAGECKITLGYSTTQYAQLGRDSSGNYELATYENGANLKFGTSQSNNATTERMRIESTGDIRFNIANAALTAGEVHTMYNVSRGNNLALYTQGADQHFSIDMWNHTGGSCNQVQFRGGGSGAVTGTITSTGNNATQYNTSSDYRLKENVDYTWDATSRLKQLKPVRFNWIDDDTNTLEDGFLAHEVSSIVPNAVRGEKDAVYTEEEASDDLHINTGDVKRQQLDHSKLVPLLVKTIQELEARIETLEG